MIDWTRRAIWLVAVLGLIGTPVVRADHTPFSPTDPIVTPRLAPAWFTTLYGYPDHHYCKVDLGLKKEALLTVDLVVTEERLKRPTCNEGILTLRRDGLPAIAWRSPPPCRGQGTIYIGLLNEDHSPDMVIDLGTTACGIMAAKDELVILLSHGNSYDAFRVVCWDFSPWHIMLYPTAKGPVLLQSAFIRGEAGQDGIPHNYWVSRMLRLDDSSFAELSGFGRRWIWYSEQSNHKESNQLTAEQKERLWRVQAGDLEVTPLATAPPPAPVPTD